MEPCICFITGPCAAGKSTIGKLLAQNNRFERAIFLEVDEIRRAVWCGYIPPYPETDASRKQLELAARATSRVAELYYHAGFWVFIGEILDPWLLPMYDEELGECERKTICLLPSAAELLKRDHSRSVTEQMGDRCIELRRLFQEWSKTKGWIVVNPRGPRPEETVAEILTLLDTNS